MHQQQQHVPGRVDPQQHHAQQRTPMQVERLPRQFDQPRPHSLVRCAGHHFQFHRHRPLRDNHLDRLTATRRKRGPQRLMARHQRIHRLLQQTRLQRTRKASGPVQVVGGTVRFQLIQKPQPLLRIR